MYYGPDITLTLEYFIRQANITIALGGRFQYLMIKNIGSGGFPGDGSDDMFGGVQIMAMYSFTLSSRSQEGQEKKYSNAARNFDSQVRLSAGSPDMVHLKDGYHSHNNHQTECY